MPETAENIKQEQTLISEVRAHRCFGCLTGDRPGKRACAAAALLAAGFDADLLARFSPSSKTEH